MDRTVTSMVKNWLLSAVLLTIVVACPVAIVMAIASTWHTMTLMQAHNSFKTILMGLHQYHDEHGHFPPVALRGENGRALHSWRTVLIPSLPSNSQGNELAGLDFTKPWDDPANLVVEEHYSLTRFPYQFLAIVGPGAAWDESGVRSLSDFKDGSSQTVLAIALRKTDIPWYQPRDAHFDGETLWLGDPADKRRVPINQDLYLLMADGEVHYRQHGLTPESLRTLITIDAGDDPGINW
jgi:hypothetical protein